MSVSSGQGSGLAIGYQISDAAAGDGLIMIVDSASTNVQKIAKLSASSATIPIGVLLRETTAANEVSTIQLSGIADVKVDGNAANIAAGDQIVSDAAGKGVKSVAANVTVQYVLGQALAPSTADGDIIPVLINASQIQNT